MIMRGRKFKLWHSLVGTAALLVLEDILLWLWPTPGTSEWIILLLGVVGAGLTIYVATEVIEEVRSARHMLVLLSVVVGEFVVFFAFNYGYLLMLDPGSFPTLLPDPLSLLLQSVMVFVFNPLNLPATDAGRALLFINTVGALGLVLFILQNIWQFRRSDTIQ